MRTDIQFLRYLKTNLNVSENDIIEEIDNKQGVRRIWVRLNKENTYTVHFDFFMNDETNLTINFRKEIDNNSNKYLKQLNKLNKHYILYKFVAYPNNIEIQTFLPSYGNIEFIGHIYEHICKTGLKELKQFN